MSSSPTRDEGDGRRGQELREAVRLLQDRSTERLGLERIRAAGDAAATPALVAHLARVAREIAEGDLW